MRQYMYTRDCEQEHRDRERGCDERVPIIYIEGKTKCRV